MKPQSSHIHLTMDGRRIVRAEKVTVFDPTDFDCRELDEKLGCDCCSCCDTPMPTELTLRTELTPGALIREVKRLGGTGG